MFRFNADEANVFLEMMSAGNGFMERFMIIVPDCRKVDPDDRDAAHQRMEDKGITIQNIYSVISKGDSASDPSFYFSDEALR